MISPWAVQKTTFLFWCRLRFKQYESLINDSRIMDEVTAGQLNQSIAIDYFGKNSFYKGAIISYRGTR